MKKLILSASLLLLAACSKDNINYKYPEDPSIVRRSRAGKFFKDDISLFDSKSQKKPAEKNSDNNNVLWISSVDVIGSLLPISVVDSKSGIIITDWYLDDKTKDERIKINLLVKGSQINEENLSVSLFRQKKDASGNWQDQASNSNLSTKLIKDKILDKAKSLAKK